MELISTRLGERGIDFDKFKLDLADNYEGKAEQKERDTATEIRDDIDAFEDAGIDTIIFSVGGRELNEIVDNVAWLSRDVLL